MAEDDQSLSPLSKSNGILHVIQPSGTWEKVPAPDSCFKIVLGDLSVSKLDSKILKSELILRLKIKGFNIVCSLESFDNNSDNNKRPTRHRKCPEFSTQRNCRNWYLWLFLPVRNDVVPLSRDWNLICVRVCVGGGGGMKSYRNSEKQFACKANLRERLWWLFIPTTPARDRGASPVQLYHITLATTSARYQGGIKSPRWDLGGS